MIQFIVFEFFAKKRRKLIGIVNVKKDALRLSYMYSQSIIDEYIQNIKTGEYELYCTYNCEGTFLIN